MDASDGGATGTRTPDPLHAMQVLFQLSYSPTGRAVYQRPFRSPPWHDHGRAACVTIGGVTAFDLLIPRGTVTGGSGAPGVRADVGVVGDRIAAVGDLSGAAAEGVAIVANAPGWVLRRAG